MLARYSAGSFVRSLGTVAVLRKGVALRSPATRKLQRKLRKQNVPRERN